MFFCAEPYTTYLVPATRNPPGRGAHLYYGILPGTGTRYLVPGPDEWPGEPTTYSPALKADAEKNGFQQYKLYPLQ